MRPNDRPVRLCLDAGVIIEGCASRWGAAKATIILATQRPRYTVVLAEQIEREVARAVARKLVTLPVEQAQAFAADIAGWFARVRLERRSPPTAEAIARAAPELLPVLRHVNDLPAVVAALEARPDWVLSGNRAHWNEALAARIGLRIVTPAEFLQRLSPQ